MKLGLDSLFMSLDDTSKLLHLVGECFLLFHAELLLLLREHYLPLGFILGLLQVFFVVIVLLSLTVLLNPLVCVALVD